MTNDQPVYGASALQSVRLFWKRYATFSGRASRSEFWWCFLAWFVVSLLLEVARLALAGGTFEGWANSYFYGGPASLPSLPSNVWALATIVPSLALTARRLHDTNRSGWWQLVAFVPLVGILVLIWCARRSDHRGCRFDSADRRAAP